MLKKYLVYLLPVNSILLCVSLIVTGCQHSTYQVKDPAQSSLTIINTKLTRDEAYLAVITRLFNMATSPAAKEYVAIYHMDSASLREYDENINAWVVGIHAGPSGYKTIEEASWFRVNDTDFFFDVHWDEPRPAWTVYDDGRVAPIGKGLLVESDIEQLNSRGVLE